METSQFTARVKTFEAGLKTLNSATNAEANAILRLNSDFQQGLITEQGYKAGLDQISISLKTTQSATDQLTIKTKVMQGVMKLTSGLLNGLMSLGATLVMSLAITGINKLINAHKDLLESTKENLNIDKENQKVMQEVIDEYAEFANKTSYTAEEKYKLNEIQSKLIETYGNEADNIDLVNGKYDEQLKLLQEINLEKAKETRDSAQAYYNETSKDYNVSQWDRMDFGRFSKQKVLFGKDIRNKLGEEYEAFIKDISNISNVSIIKNERNGSLVSTEISNNSKNIESNLKAWEQVQDVLRNYGLENEDIFTKVNEKYAETSESVNNYKQAVQDLAQAEFDYQMLSNPFNFDENATKEKFEKWKNNIIKDISDSTIAEEFINIANTEWKKVNISPEINISPTFTYDRNAVDNAVSEVENMFNGDSDSGSKSTIFDKVEKFEKAIENIGKNGFIGRTDYEELLEIYPAIADVFEQTADGYTASLLDMTNSTRDFIDENSKIISDAQAVTFNQISDVNKQIAETDKKIFEARKGGYDNRYEVEQLYAVKNALIEQKNELEETTSKLKEYEMAMNFDEEKASIDATTESIGILNSSMKTLSGAFAEINENGTISVETLLTLIENGYATAIMYDRQTGAITLNRQVLEELDKARIQAMIDELELSKATSTHTAEIEAQIVALKNLQNNWSEIYSGTYSGSSSSTSTSTVTDTTDYYKENAEAQISALKHQYEIGNIEAIAYYNQLLDLTKYFYEGKSEYLDEYQKYEKEVYDGLAKAQKERLESEKDKITEANTEREKAIELIKAHNELMNAKENKTIRSYSEEKGWEYVQDKENILEAKQNLDKLISEYKANLIDDKIDEIQKMNFDALKEAVNKPIQIPTNTDIMKDVQRNIIENIQNNNNNDNSKNVVINIENINPNNFDDFMNELNEVLEQSILNIGIGL